MAAHSRCGCAQGISFTAIHWLGAATSEIGRRDLRKDVCGGDAEDCPVIPCPDSFDHYAKRGFGSIRSAVAASPNACIVMFDTLEKACSPIAHRPRVEILRDQARQLLEQARLAIGGPDLVMVEKRYLAMREATEG